MKKDSIIFIAGHNGLVGSAIMRKLKSEGYERIIFRPSGELDLRSQESVVSFFSKEKPEYIFFAAGTVGGIMANKSYPGDFIYDNLMIISNTLQAARINKVKKFLYLGSSCIYPKNSIQPIKEEYLLTGELEETNKPYALAKIAGIEMCYSFNKQFDMNNICLIPTNIFGINDNYDLTNSHLVAALIRKFHEAKINNSPYVELWGTGTPQREILCSDELANACLFFMLNYNGNEIINIGVGKDYTISQIAEIIKNVTNYKGQIKFDSSKPDGTIKKQLDVSRASNLGWSSTSDLQTDLRRTYLDFITNYNKYTI
ncbi:MAG: GDP-L-fucose synthase [Actinobacteria bacterium]|nr:GDP-L-fucose synthase [Actinomycetota bacterium]